MPKMKNTNPLCVNETLINYGIEQIKDETTQDFNTDCEVQPHYAVEQNTKHVTTLKVTSLCTFRLMLFEPIDISVSLQSI